MIQNIFRVGNFNFYACYEFTKHNGIKFNFKLLPIYLYHETINAVLW